MDSEVCMFLPLQRSYGVAHLILGSSQPAKENKASKTTNELAILVTQVLVVTTFTIGHLLNGSNAILILQ